MRARSGLPSVQPVASAPEHPRYRRLHRELQTVTLKVTLVASRHPDPMLFGLECAGQTSAGKYLKIGW